MKQMGIAALAGALFLQTLACEPAKEEPSLTKIVEETAVVAEKKYHPSTEGFTPVPIGEMIYCMPTGSPESYNITFAGEHTLALNNKEIFDKYVRGERVVVTYNVVYVPYHGERPEQCGWMESSRNAVSIRGN